MEVKKEDDPDIYIPYIVMFLVMLPKVAYSEPKTVSSVCGVVSQRSQRPYKVQLQSVLTHIFLMPVNIIVYPEIIVDCYKIVC